MAETHQSYQFQGLTNAPFPIMLNAKYVTAVTVVVTNEGILELIWWWSWSSRRGSSSLCLLLHAKQYEQMDQLMVKWHDKVWKWHTVTTRTHNGWLNPVSPAGPLGPSYQAGTFSTFHSLPLNPFRRLHYMSTVAHCLHQRLCVSTCVSCVCACVWVGVRACSVLADSSLQCKNADLIRSFHSFYIVYLLWRLFSQERLSERLE